MKRRAFISLFCVIAAWGAGCAKHGALEQGKGHGACAIEIVFSQSSTSYKEGAMAEDPFWVGIDVTLSDSTFDFGYLNELGNFIHMFSGKKGSFEGGGGQRLVFALRDSGGKRTVYDMNEFGSCRFLGAQVKANKAVLPALKHDYYSSVEIIFDVPGRREVTVLLSSPEPNGFTSPLDR